MDIVGQLSALTGTSRPTPGAPFAGLKAGQIVQAQVVGSTTAGMTRLAIGTQVLDVALPGRLAPGTSVQLEVTADGLGTRLQVLDRPTGQQSRPLTSVARGQTVALALQNVPPGPGRAAAAEMTQAALSRQDSMTTLFASLARLDGKLAAFPKGIESSGTQALAAVLNLNGRLPTGQALKTAVQRSGLFLEAMLARGGPRAALRGDLKAALLSLSRALKPWTAGVPSPDGPRGARPAPPSRGGVPRAQRAPGPIVFETASRQELARALGTQVEAALSRLRLAQLASLPQNIEQVAAGAKDASGEWTFELPLLFGEEMGVVQFQIRRDSGSDPSDADRAWQMHFAINFEATGGVNAKVVLRGGKISVALWAEREETAEMLDRLMPELAAALEGHGLSIGSLTCQHGAPEQPVMPAGAFMDRTT